MEKNGAITSNTPRCPGGCGCGGNCNCKIKTATTKQLLLFPDNAVTADEYDQDLLKTAVDLVKDKSKPIT